MAFRGSRDHSEVEMSLSSMVDIVFLLLIYFIVTSSIKQEEMELKVAIPMDNQIQVEEQIDIPEEVVIDVFPNGQVYWNGQPTDSPDDIYMGELKNTLVALREQSPEQAVVIRGQSDTLHKRIVAVLNACSAAKIENISFPSDPSVYK